MFNDYFLVDWKMEAILKENSWTMLAVSTEGLLWISDRESNLS